MILFYTEELNPRIEYTARLIFKNILQSEITLTTNAKEFVKSDLPKINYSYKKFGDELYIKPNRFIMQKLLDQPVIKPVFYEGAKYFFESSKESDLPFDPFSASFYLVARYEEYLEGEYDKYKRYHPENSILIKNGLLKKPVVNIWAYILADKLRERFPHFVFPKSKFKFISTIDIDNAWLYSHKEFIRTIGGVLKGVFKGCFSEVINRLEVLTGRKQDPYHTYPFINKVFAGNEDKVIFFFLLGNYSRYDKNVSFKNKHLKKLIREMAEKYRVGIHPSFFSSGDDNNNRLRIEISRLEEITGNKIIRSRQHYVKIEFPDTYHRLLKYGIKEDYTMGYASHTGFRAGICTPYYFYDLKNETTTNLKVIPFQIMDITMRDYMRLTPEQSMNEIDSLMQEVKKVGGTFVSIWHNESLSDNGEWNGYREVFEKMNKKGFE